MSDIASFKVLYVDLWNGEGFADEKQGIKGYERLPEFIEKVNLYLRNGYTLHGTTLNVSTGLITNHRFSQALIRHSDKHGPHIIEYSLVYASSAGKIRQLNGEITERSMSHSDFEEKIFHLLQNGWCLFGDLQSCYSRTATTNYNGEHQYSQVLVKYKHVES